MVKQIIPDDLTDDQQKALDGYFNNPEKYRKFTPVPEPEDILDK